MFYYVFKIAISVAVIVAVSEITKRHSGFAALIAALPLTSLLPSFGCMLKALLLTLSVGFLIKFFG